MFVRFRDGLRLLSHGSNERTTREQVAQPFIKLNSTLIRCTKKQSQDI